MFKIQPGTRVRFNRGDKTVQTDTVREIFWQETLGTTGMPGGHPHTGVALVLSEHSWIWATQVTDVFSATEGLWASHPDAMPA